jgi:dihydrofolate synthase / folylpolyglutamate synthase
MTYEAAVRTLLSLGPEMKAGASKALSLDGAGKFGLEGITRLAAALGNPQLVSPSVLIAGTNGKGSTAAMIEAALRESGYRTGLYTSPHLARINERIRVNGADIPDDDFGATFGTISETVERLLASGGLAKHASFFECVTAMGWVYFRERQCQVQVLEVGLGGRLDATNISQPMISVITPVDMDHETYLGNTLELIAGEKAGIIKDDGVVVMAPQHPAAEAVISEVARERHARLIRVTEPASGYELSLIGEHQRWNAATALAAIAELRAQGWTLPEGAVRRALANTHWPGRLERIAERPDVYLDGAHNPAGARVLRDFMRTMRPPRVLVFGAMRDKAIGEIAEILFPEADAVVLTQPSHNRAASPETLREIASHLNDYLYLRSSPGEAVDLGARLAGAEGTVFVAGSLFLIGDVKVLRERTDREMCRDS